MKRSLKIAETLLAASGMLSFLVSWVMGFWLRETMPTQADSKFGYTIPIIMNGRTIYLNPFYDILHTALFWGGLLLFFCAALIDFHKDPFDRNRSRK